MQVYPKLHPIESQTEFPSSLWKCLKIWYHRSWILKLSHFTSAQGNCSCHHHCHYSLGGQHFPLCYLPHTGKHRTGNTHVWNHQDVFYKTMFRQEEKQYLLDHSLTPSQTFDFQIMLNRSVLTVNQRNKPDDMWCSDIWFPFPHSQAATENLRSRVASCDVSVGLLFLSSACDYFHYNL